MPSSLAQPCLARCRVTAVPLSTCLPDHVLRISARRVRTPTTAGWGRAPSNFHGVGMAECAACRRWQERVPRAVHSRTSLPLHPKSCINPPPPPCVTFRRVAVSLRGPGRSPGLPFACCVGSLRSVGRCGRCSCWCRFRVRGAPLTPPDSATTPQMTANNNSRACNSNGTERRLQSMVPNQLSWNTAPSHTHTHTHSGRWNEAFGASARARAPCTATTRDTPHLQNSASPPPYARCSGPRATSRRAQTQPPRGPEVSPGAWGRANPRVK